MTKKTLKVHEFLVAHANLKILHKVRKNLRGRTTAHFRNSGIGLNWLSMTKSMTLTITLTMKMTMTMMIIMILILMMMIIMNMLIRKIIKNKREWRYTNFGCICFFLIFHSISNRKFGCFSYIIAMVHQNSPTVEFWQEKIEGNLRRANTEPSVDFRRANAEPSVDFRKANTEPSVYFTRANMETYWK